MVSFVKSVVEAVAFVNGLWLAYCRPPQKDHHRPPHKGHIRLPRKGTVDILRTVEFVNGLKSIKRMASLSTGLF